MVVVQISGIYVYIKQTVRFTCHSLETEFTVLIIQADPAKLEIGFNKGVCLIVD